MIIKENYILTDEDWNLENINKKVLELAKEVEKMNLSQDEIFKKYDIYQILSSLWLNRNNNIRYPDFFEELKVPKIFHTIFDDIFIDF